MTTNIIAIIAAQLATLSNDGATPNLDSRLTKSWRIPLSRRGRRALNSNTEQSPKEKKPMTTNITAIIAAQVATLSNDGAAANLDTRLTKVWKSH